MMRFLKEAVLGLYVISTAAMAGQDDVIAKMAIDNAKVKPAQAMAIISKAYEGRLTEFSLDDDDRANGMVYEFEIVDQKAGQKIEAYVDSQTGAVQETDRDRIRNMGQYDALFKGTTLQDAVTQAKTVVPGTLIEAELESEKGVVYFETELMTDKGVEKVVVNVANGQPIPVASRRHGA